MNTNNTLEFDSHLAVFTVPKNLNLAEWEEPQTDTNKPFLRHKLIIEKLQSISTQIHFVTEQPDSQKLYQFLLTLGHDPDLLHFLKDSWASWEEDRARFPEYATNYGGFGCAPFARSRDVNYKNLPLFRQFGYWLNEFATPIYKHSWDSAILSLHLVLRSVEHFERSSERVLYSLTPFPGHHADLNSSSGYCFINNIAIAAKVLAKNNKVSILDIDFHHGDGTQRIFYEDDSVLTISIHADPRYEYPTYFGHTSENTSTNFNFPLCAKDEVNGQVPISVYLSKGLEPALKKITEWRPDILLLAFGADTWKGDLDALPGNRFALELTDYVTIGRKISQAHPGRIFVTQEGGYDLQNVPSVVAHLFEGLLGK